MNQKTIARMLMVNWELVNGKDIRDSGQNSLFLPALRCSRQDVCSTGGNFYVNIFAYLS